MEKMQDGRIKVTAADFPTFLYPLGTEYDPGTIDTQLFRGPLLVRVSTFFYNSGILD